jgi:3-oxoacyl-[acyl-carrier protein] reductase
MDLGLKAKRALVTGGSHGIGLAAAKVLAAEGCDVAICSRTPERLAAAVEVLRPFGNAVIADVCDVHSAAAIQAFCDDVLKRWSGVDILVNNVGGGGRWGKPSVEDTDEKVWIEVYEKNALAAVRFTTRLLPAMRKQKWGRVVTVTSRLGREGGGRPWFNMAKAAQTSMMKTLGMNHELAGAGITFNSVAPGNIMIPGTAWEEQMKADPAGFQRYVAAECPLGRLGTPEEVAAVIAFICSAQASLINGAAIAVDGGESRAF